MAKVTTKLQVTIPKALADQYGIEPGDEIDFEAAGEVIRVLPPGRRSGARLGLEERLRLFDEETARQRRRRGTRTANRPTADRGWRREELYDRGEPR